MTNLDKIYIVIHHATFADGNYPNYDDNMIGCYKNFNDAKNALLNFPKLQLDLFEAENKSACCDECKEVYATGYDSPASGERYSIYEMRIH